MSLLMIKPELKRLNLKHPLHFLAVGFGSGLSPKAPGTMGRLPPSPLPAGERSVDALVHRAAGAGLRGGHSHLPERHRCHRHAGSRCHRLGRGDRFWGHHDSGTGRLGMGAGRFRAVPVVRHPQALAISWFDRRIHGGLGIMLDDLIAGLFALFVCNHWHTGWVEGDSKGSAMLASPYISLFSFHSSAYAAVKKSFHINIHYSFEA